MQKFKSPGQIKVGVIGYGGAFNMGRQHLREMQKAGMTPFAVCELDPERLKVAREDFPGIETYGTLEDMLKRSDVNLLVHITPHNLHFPMAMKCVAAGKHVVTEKPFVITTAEADKLIAAAKKKGVMVSTYHNRHWDGCILKAVEQVVEKKVIGDIHRVEAHMGGYNMPKDWWRTSKSISGGVLYDWGVHLLEYALQVVRSEVVEVSGFARKGYWASKMKDSQPWKKDCNEDEAFAIVRFRNGTLLNLSISHLRTDTNSNRVTFHGSGGSWAMGWQEATLRKPNAKGQVVEKVIKQPKDQGFRFYQNIAGYLAGKEKLVITPEWARRPIHILDLANQSAAKNKALTAKYG